MLDLVERLRGLIAAAPSLPWHYRPQEYDDWGFIRGGVPSEYGLPVVALGREGGLTQADHDAHRKAGTDPYGPASELIVAVVNSTPELLNNIEAAEARIAQLEDALAWQPIESAPMDGTIIIVTTGSATGTARWRQVASRDTLNDYDDGSGMRAVFAPVFGWHSVSDRSLTKTPPTHWMPLPTPPAALQNAGGLE